ncbi:Gfo/Idh/MocA family protein [Dyadobacter pollutisoli]|uniref:Gfo/Idh/MocA family oxidoreductase n=1 Tax=Dyadobacter pollutisoli TaxID=2910158 RepID=A0A9E8SML2_9BACT|nr:Gfo/Idh/MocA family oxidoreductase [Dyadobacter pollutisoli]WAC14865.1 Gfo/Idh/MocA family oxidoreductase [Dyadobacter pollutisoli]
MQDEFKSVSRRDFLLTSAAALTPPLLLGMSLPASTADGKLNHASIGVGGMGAHDLKNFMQHPNVNITAICDVDADILKKASALVPNARTYSDWREMLEKEKKNIQSVNVSVPDHTHFSAAYTAIKAGKHVYCQKPMCHDVAEVRLLTEIATKAGVVTQLGTQVASTSCDRTAVQLIKNKAVGKIKHVYLCSNRPGAIDTYRLVGPRPAQGQEAPANLNWDLWLGTAPRRDYMPGIYHQAKWRAWQDFGTGWSGDIGCHIFDAVWKGLGLKTPKSVIAEVQQSWKDSAQRRGDTWPQGDHITWVFPGNDYTESDELTLEWFDGLFYPPENIRALYSVEDYPAESAMLVGTEGALLIPHGGAAPILLPESKFAKTALPKFESRNHYHHFVDACLGGEKTESHFAQSGPMTEAILLGTVALRAPNELLEWDAKKLKFPNHPEANKYLRRTYRKGWEIKGAF